MPFAQDDSCSAKMKVTCHHSPFGMMYLPLTDSLGADVLTWFLVGFPASHSVTRATDARTLKTSGRTCYESSERFTRELCSRKMSKKVRFSKQDQTLSLWDINVDTDAMTHGLPGHRIAARVGGLLATPTKTANQSAASMQKHLSCRAYTAIFGTNRISPNHYEWMMGWPLGWTAIEPLETAKFQQWLSSHGKPSPQEVDLFA